MGQRTGRECDSHQIDAAIRGLSCQVDAAIRAVCAGAMPLFGTLCQAPCRYFRLWTGVQIRPRRASSYRRRGRSRCFRRPPVVPVEGRSAGEQRGRGGRRKGRISSNQGVVLILSGDLANLAKPRRPAVGVRQPQPLPEPVVYLNWSVGYLAGCQHFGAAPPHRVRLSSGVWWSNESESASRGGSRNESARLWASM